MPRCNGIGGVSFFPHTKKQVQVHGRRGRRERNFPEVLNLDVDPAGDY